ncbi:excalibur calcium-binding domain-containing protein [Maritalea mediterranea]|uniref:Excalibur calcium-binding domain-containing protein n=1 Tax=Maritalea mediterranea TaxID=2909667 RepID=A0ABS9EA81_9HYPH|nr:excalibur calcium-binding domain-containing protein [Maritalea mediterranea]MCF4099785.1 excalibur calcium-binding domain-containing protein [Maritalea mediterranea]
MPQLYRRTSRVPDKSLVDVRTILIFSMIATVSFFAVSWFAKGWSPPQTVKHFLAAAGCDAAASAGLFETKRGAPGYWPHHDGNSDGVACELTSRPSVGLCSGGNRAARRVTCVVDGDTIWEEGSKLRFLDIDAAETDNKASCAAERVAAAKGAQMVIEAMQTGYRIHYTGRTGGYGRDLVKMYNSDGQDVGQLLIQQGFAQPWPNSSNPWCD